MNTRIREFPRDISDLFDQTSGKIVHWTLGENATRCPDYLVSDGRTGGGRTDGRASGRTGGRASGREGGRTGGRAGGRTQGFIQRGDGGDLSPSWFWQGGISPPPIKRQNSVFFNGHFSEVLQESVQKTNPFFSKFVFSNCLPLQSEINNYENLTILFIRFLDMNQLLSALNFTIIYCPNNPSIWCQIVLGLCIYLNFRPDCYRCSCQVVFAEKWWNFHGRFSRDLRSQMLGKRISGGPEIQIFWGRPPAQSAPSARWCPPPPINFFLAETLGRAGGRADTSPSDKLPQLFHISGDK